MDCFTPCALIVYLYQPKRLERSWDPKSLPMCCTIAIALRFGGNGCVSEEAIPTPPLGIKAVKTIRLFVCVAACVVGTNNCQAGHFCNNWFGTNCCQSSQCCLPCSNPCYVYKSSCCDDCGCECYSSCESCGCETGEPCACSVSATAETSAGSGTSESIRQMQIELSELKTKLQQLDTNSGNIRQLQVEVAELKGRVETLERKINSPAT